jgi:hypothetical protein
MLRSLKSIRHFCLIYRKAPSNAKLQKLFKANKELAIQVALDKHIKEGLIESLKLKKRYWKQGKKLNLLNKDNHNL